MIKKNLFYEHVFMDYGIDAPLNVNFVYLYNCLSSGLYNCLSSGCLFFVSRIFIKALHRAA